MVRLAKDYVVENFDFQKLASSDEVTCDLNISLRRSRVPARMIVLCGAAIYVQ